MVNKMEKNRDFSGYPDDLRKAAEQADEEVRKKISSGESCILPGQCGTPLNEPLGDYDPVECEEVYPSQKELHCRHRISFLRDRNERSHFSGYGGRGSTTAGAIDIVVGSGGNKPKHRQKVGPNFFTDAARIYLSQRADIDQYLDLPFGQSTGLQASENRSAIAIKADAVRVVGREGVRIYTNPSTPTNPSIVASDAVNETSSRGGKIESNGPDRGIHLIAHKATGTYTALNPIIPGRKGAPFQYTINRLQPMVKGDNLVILLKEIIGQLQDIVTWTQNFTNSQMSFNSYIANHTHQVASASPGIATPSPEAVASYLQELVGQINNHVTVATIKKYDFAEVERVFLEPTGEINILSRYNKTN